MATKQQKYEALKTAIEIAKEYARSAAEGYPTGVMKDSYKAIIAIMDEIEKSDDWFSLSLAARFWNGFYLFRLVPEYVNALPIILI